MSIHKNKAQGDTDVLVIPSGNEKFTREQLEFNKLLIRFRKGDKKLLKEEKLFDSKLETCVKIIYPLEAGLNEMLADLLESLDHFLKNEQISNLKEEALLRYMTSQINRIKISPYRLSDERRKRMAEISQSLNNVVDLNRVQPLTDVENSMEEFDEFVRRIRRKMESMGFDIDLSGLHRKMSEDEISEYIKVRTGQSGNANGKRKTRLKDKSKTQQRNDKKQVESDESTSAGITELYRQLVKLIHPDAEQNQEIKIRKEEWMKRLTVAYGKQDLKTILEIEFEWAGDVGERIMMMPEEKLSLYNATLRRQAMELERRAVSLGEERKYHLLAYFAGNSGAIKTWKPEQTRDRLKSEILAIRLCVHQLSLRNKESRQAVEKLISGEHIFSGI